MEKVMIKECCGVCEMEKELGIHIYHMFICESCEREIVQTEPEQTGYGLFVQKLKEITKPKLYS